MIMDRLALVNKKSKLHLFDANTMITVKKVSNDSYVGTSIMDGATQILKSNEFTVVGGNKISKQTMNLRILTDEELDYYGDEYIKKQEDGEIEKEITFIQYLSSIA